MVQGEARPKAVGRQQLYDLVWAKPMIHAAAEYGISGNGLAKVCRKLDVPYPERGYWAKHAVGKAPPATPLPSLKPGMPSSATISSAGTLSEGEPPEIIQARADFEDARQRHAAISVPERLAKPHAIIAKWQADKKARQERARRERDPWTRSLYSEADFTATDRRRHRILHTLFKALEGHGGVIVETDRKELQYEQHGVALEFQLREKSRQVQRPLTQDEKRWRLATDKDWRLELEPTGMLLFEFKTYSLGGLKRNWLESESKPMETLLPGILATFAAGIPLLVEEKRKRDEQAQRWRDAEQRRAQEEAKRRIDDARWRKFLELAGKLQQAEIASALLERIKSSEPDLLEAAGSSTVGEWLNWLESRITATDPLKNGAARLFDQLAETNQWTYRN